MNVITHPRNIAEVVENNGEDGPVLPGRRENLSNVTLLEYDDSSDQYKIRGYTARGPVELTVKPFEKDVAFCLF